MRLTGIVSGKPHNRRSPEKVNLFESGLTPIMAVNDLLTPDFQISLAIAVTRIEYIFITAVVANIFRGHHV